MLIKFDLAIIMTNQIVNKSVLISESIQILDDSQQILGEILQKDDLNLTKIGQFLKSINKILLNLKEK